MSEEGPNGAYATAARWIVDYARNTVGLKSCTTVEYVKGKPVVLMEWPGSKPELPRVLLNSHYDVVPAMAEHWDTDPFAAVKDEASGRIYGRGTQVGVTWLAVILQLTLIDQNYSSGIPRANGKCRPPRFKGSAFA